MWSKTKPSVGGTNPPCSAAEWQSKTSGTEAHFKVSKMQWSKHRHNRSGGIVPDNSDPK